MSTFFGLRGVHHTTTQLSATKDRAVRADARRNMERVLRAAEELFASDGLAVPIDDIARRAGVGVGTVYRHFPTKGALFEAIARSRLEGLVERARQLSTDADAGKALFVYLAELVRLAVEKRDLMDELARAGGQAEELHAGMKRALTASLNTLLKRAQAVGAVRRDIAGPDLASLVMGTCAAACQRRSPESNKKLLAVLCDGLRPPGTGH